MKNEKFMPNLYVALTHYPVINKRGDIIASALTNLDIHDISRAAKTYGVKRFYVVTPLSDQKVLAKKIIAHWTGGAGAAYNPDRRSAFELTKIKDSIQDVVKDIEDIENCFPKTITTCARRYPTSISYPELRDILEGGLPHLLIFGTAWGLAESMISEANFVLEPITGAAGYNHLSVRSAVSIILDRLLKPEN